MHPLIVAMQEQRIKELVKDKDNEIPNFKPGDKVKVHVSITEGDRQRIQLFEGTVISRRNRGITSCFTVRKISHDNGVERTFMIYASTVKKIEVVSRGIVRRAKLYYLRDLKGKAAKVKQKLY